MRPRRREFPSSAFGSHRDFRFWRRSDLAGLEFRGLRAGGRLTILRQDFARAVEATHL